MKNQNDSVKGTPPKPPVKEAKPSVSNHDAKSKQPRGVKGWLIRLVNRAIKRLSKFR